MVVGLVMGWNWTENDSDGSFSWWTCKKSQRSSCMERLTSEKKCLKITRIPLWPQRVSPSDGERSESNGENGRLDPHHFCFVPPVPGFSPPSTSLLRLGHTAATFLSPASRSPTHWPKHKIILMSPPHCFCYSTRPSSGGSQGRGGL